MSKVVFVLILLGIIMSAAMVIPPETINDRLQVSITLLLATVFPPLLITSSFNS